MTTLKKVNPYFQMGEFLKDGLNYFIKNMPDKKIYKFQDIANIVGIYINSIEFSSKNSFEANTINTKGRAAVAINQFFDDFETNYFESNSIEELINISQTDYLNFIYLINNIENKAYSSEILSDEQRLILIGTSLGRASADYWEDQVDSPTSLWKDYLGKPPKFLSKWALASIKGAIYFASRSGLMSSLTAAIVFSIFEIIENKNI